MTLTFKQIVVGSTLVILGIALGLILVYRAHIAFGGQSSDSVALTSIYRTYDFFASTTAAATIATSTTATSTNINALLDSNGVWNNGAMDIRGAKKVDVYFTRGAALGGSMLGTSTYAIQVTPDGTNWYYFNRLVVSTSSPSSQIANMFIAASDPTMNTPITIDDGVAGGLATTTLHYMMDLSSAGFQAMRCIARQVATSTTPNGTNQCQAAATF